MDPYSTGTSDEAQRWIVIAEKLLTARDLVGSKTFAIRARESDPNLEPAYQILAVADTLLAGEKRINGQHDWYAVLQLAGRTHDSDIVAAQFRRLALLLNPQRNNLPFADLALNLISDAWSVLSNPSTKSMYDNQLNFQPTLNSVGPSREHQERVQQTLNKPQEEQTPNKHRHHQQHTVRRSPRKSTNNNIIEEEEEEGGEEESRLNHTPDDESSSFWTSCPYCYNMYEYPRIYAECTLRCQNCLRAFQGVRISSPPTILDGKEAYFCCWAFFPIGVSNIQKNKDRSSNWTPFSPMFTYPEAAEKKGNGGVENVNVGGPKKVNDRAPKSSNAQKSSAPRVYIEDDDDDGLVEISESGEDSDDQWGNSRRKKKARGAKGKGLAGKNVNQSQGDRAKNVKRGSGENLQGGFVMQEDAGVSNVPVAETSNKVVGNNSKRQPGRVARELGKLDLNVEFNNEVEEPPPGMSEKNGTGHREEDNIEGIGFFEGLDEFLSSLPILATK